MKPCPNGIGQSKRAKCQVAYPTVAGCLGRLGIPTDCEVQLKELDEFPDLPENAIDRLDSLDNQIKQGQEEADELRERQHKENEDVEVPIPNEKLLGATQRVERIRRMRGRFDESVGDLPDRQIDLERLQVESNRHLADLGADWDEERLATIDTSAARRQEIEELLNQNDQTKYRMREAEVSCNREEQEFTRIQDALKQSELALQQPVHNQDQGSGPEPAWTTCLVLRTDREYTAGSHQFRWFR